MACVCVTLCDGDVCREGMVRAAVRTLTLHVYSVGDPDIQTFVTSAPASSYFSEVAMYLAEQIQVSRLCHRMQCSGPGTVIAALPDR
jgi:hypothetical protein